jgi:hypothetical protein
MHRSKLSTFVIDCETGDIDSAATSWSRALGKELAPAFQDEPNYRELTVSRPEPMLLVQKVDHPGRIHLDIESDDLDAEVARLEALGAKRIGFVKRWWVMEAPTVFACAKSSHARDVRGDPWFLRAYDRATMHVSGFRNWFARIYGRIGRRLTAPLASPALHVENASYEAAGPLARARKLAA